MKPKTYLFILGKLNHHGTTHSNWIFIVYCSFSMGYITQTIFITPWTILILAPTTKQKRVGTPCYFLTTTKNSIDPIVL